MGYTERSGLQRSWRVSAVDTNILVYAHREDSPFHEAAFRRVAELAEGSAVWAIPWPCIYEFLAIVTHPRIYAPPTPLDRALDQVDAWLESPTLAVLVESAPHWRTLRGLLAEGRVVGPRSTTHASQRFVANTACVSFGRRTETSARFAGLAAVSALVGGR